MKYHLRIYINFVLSYLTIYIANSRCFNKICLSPLSEILISNTNPLKMTFIFYKYLEIDKNESGSIITKVNGTHCIVLAKSNGK